MNNLHMSQYLSWIEGSPPKRNAVGSNPIWDAKKHRKHKTSGAFSHSKSTEYPCETDEFLAYKFARSYA